jgi:anti-anti-sigma regulatory factor
MNAFHLQANGTDLLLRLSQEVTIEHARELHAALVTALPHATALRIDAREVTHIDVSILQLLLAASELHRPVIEETSDAWLKALRRFGLANTALSASEIP